MRLREGGLFCALGTQQRHSKARAVDDYLPPPSRRPTPHTIPNRLSRRPPSPPPLPTPTSSASSRSASAPAGPHSRRPPTRSGPRASRLRQTCCRSCSWRRRSRGPGRAAAAAVAASRAARQSSGSSRVEPLQGGGAASGQGGCGPGSSGSGPLGGFCPAHTRTHMQTRVFYIQRQQGWAQLRSIRPAPARPPPAASNPPPAPAPHPPTQS
jgi:hypothetical protein